MRPRVLAASFVLVVTAVLFLLARSASAELPAELADLHEPGEAAEAAERLVVGAEPTLGEAGTTSVEAGSSLEGQGLPDLPVLADGAGDATEVPARGMSASPSVSTRAPEGSQAPATGSRSEVGAEAESGPAHLARGEIERGVREHQEAEAVVATFGPVSPAAVPAEMPAGPSPLLTSSADAPPADVVPPPEETATATAVEAPSPSGITGIALTDSPRGAGERLVRPHHHGLPLALAPAVAAGGPVVGESGAHSLWHRSIGAGPAVVTIGQPVAPEGPHPAENHFSSTTASSSAVVLVLVMGAFGLFRCRVAPNLRRAVLVAAAGRIRSNTVLGAVSGAGPPPLMSTTTTLTTVPSSGVPAAPTREPASGGTAAPRSCSQGSRRILLLTASVPKHAGRPQERSVHRSPGVSPGSPHGGPARVPPAAVQGHRRCLLASGQPIRRPLAHRASPGRARPRAVTTAEGGSKSQAHPKHPNP